MAWTEPKRAVDGNGSSVQLDPSSHFWVVLSSPALQYLLPWLLPVVSPPVSFLHHRPPASSCTVPPSYPSYPFCLLSPLPVWLIFRHPLLYAPILVISNSLSTPCYLVFLPWPSCMQVFLPCVVSPPWDPSTCLFPILVLSAPTLRPLGHLHMPFTLFSCFSAFGPCVPPLLFRASPLCARL